MFFVESHFHNIHTLVLFGILHPSFFFFFLGTATLVQNITNVLATYAVLLFFLWGMLVFLRVKALNCLMDLLLFFIKMHFW